MWDQYKKTFVGMQTTIFVVTALVFLRTHYWMQAFVFFLIMQLGSAGGALWSNRLKRKLQPEAACLPPIHS